MITRQIFKRLTFGKLLEIKSVKSHTFRSARVRFAHLRRSDSINCSIDFVDPTTSSSFHWWWFLAVIQYSDDSTTLVHISHPFPFSCFTPHLPNTYYPAITIDFASVIHVMCAIWTLLWEWVNQMSHNESSSTHPQLCGATMRRDGDRWSEEKKQKKKQRTNKECFVENNKWPVKTLTSFSFSALNPLLKRHLEASEADSFRRFIKICSIIGVTTDPRTNYKICDLMFAPFSDLNTFTNMTFLDISVYWDILWLHLRRIFMKEITILNDYLFGSSVHASDWLDWLDSFLISSRYNCATLFVATYKLETDNVVEKIELNESPA